MTMTGVFRRQVNGHVVVFTLDRPRANPRARRLATARLTVVLSMPSQATTSLASAAGASAANRVRCEGLPPGKIHTAIRR